MNRDDILRMAREAGAMFDHMTWVERDLQPVFERFHSIAVAAEREKIVVWMMRKAFATGCGDTVEDLLDELEWQVAERALIRAVRIIEAQDVDPAFKSRMAAAVRAMKKETPR